MSNADRSKKRKLYYRDMTVANIRIEEKAEFVEVVFLESARFYRLLRENSAYGGILKKLENAFLNGKPIKAGFTSIDSDIIEEVK
jgi:hypothetical protein